MMASITLQVWTYSERIICGETGGVECRLSILLSDHNFDCGLTKLLSNLGNG